MTPGRRTHKAASCRVAVAMGLPEDMREQTREIVGVQSTNPRKGHATALMHTVCAEADREWMTLLIHVEPFSDGMTEEQLLRWYGRFGFVKIQDDPILMARSPQKSMILRAH